MNFLGVLCLHLLCVIFWKLYLKKSVPITKSYAEVKLYQLDPIDKEYTLQIASKKVQIYCHDMGSDSPKVSFTRLKGIKGHTFGYHVKITLLAKIRMILTQPFLKLKCYVQKEFYTVQTTWGFLKLTDLFGLVWLGTLIDLTYHCFCIFSTLIKCLSFSSLF